MGIEDREVIEKVEQGYRMPKPTNEEISFNLYNLILDCWNVVSTKRPTFEFLNHYFEHYPVTSEPVYTCIQKN